VNVEGARCHDVNHSIHRPDQRREQGEARQASGMMEGAQTQQDLSGEPRQPVPQRAGQRQALEYLLNQAFGMGQYRHHQRSQSGRRRRSPPHLIHPRRLRAYLQQHHRTAQHQRDGIHQPLRQRRGLYVCLAQRRLVADDEAAYHFPCPGGQKGVAQVSRHGGPEHRAQAELSARIEQHAPAHRPHKEVDDRDTRARRQVLPPRAPDNPPHAYPFHPAE
jgi:hypothetical protein